ncbi:MAG: hypothetical protein ABIQ93_14505, partial [Saprospiraceae bacterium]
MKNTLLFFRIPIVRISAVTLLWALASTGAPAQAPGIAWKQITWADEDLFDNFQPQNASGEEWWYSHKNIYNGSVQMGYVTVGYSSVVVTPASFVQAQIVYNEGPNACYNPVGNFPINNACTYAYNFGCTDCGDRDYVGEHRAPVRGMVALNDLQGNMIWCKPVTAGEIQEVIQIGNFIYVVGDHYGAKSYEDHVFLPYNPTAAQPNNYFDLTTGLFSCFAKPPNNQGQHFYLAKLDLAGNIIWQNLYGFEDYNQNADNAFKGDSYGYDLIKSSNGNIIACGNAGTIAMLDGETAPFVLEVNPLNGFVIKKKILPVTSVLSTSGDPGARVDCHSIAESGTSQTYAVASLYEFRPSPFVSTDWHEGVVWIINSNFNPVILTSNTNPIHLPVQGLASQNSNIWEVLYHQNELLIPAIINCSTCYYAGDNRGECCVYRYKPDGSLASPGPNPIMVAASVGAFDLRAGIAETNDGGFVVVSTTHTYLNNPAPTPAELGNLANCQPFINGQAIWDTDPIVVKFDANNNKVWETTFDILPGRTRQPFPGDIKRQECLYKITQAQDGGYVVSGNSSYNFDDSYLFKLYDDCNSTRNFSVSDPTDHVVDISTNTTWNTSQKVVGSVVVKNGATLTITGRSTVIEFADSKLTGIPTNID